VGVPFTVADLLALPTMVPARPEVAVGVDLDRRPVRWIHTSEIYEISPLLKGGEVLLTTGLGLVGMSPDALAAYVRSLAAKDVAALMLELGRTFTRAPDALTGAAAEHGLPLVLLHGVVPFIDITETVHAMLLAGEVEQLRAQDRVSTVLNRALLAGRGLADLVGATAAMCGAPVGLFSPSGVLLAGSAVDPTAPTAFAVEVGVGPWASLVVVPRLAAEESAEVRRTAQLCATAVGICLVQESRVSPTRRTAAADLVRDLASGRYLPSSEITSRAGAVGFLVPPEHRAVGLAVQVTAPTAVRSGLSATTEAARSCFGPCLVAEVDGEVLLAVTVPLTNPRQLLAGFADAVDAELAATVGGSLVRLTAGPLVGDAAGLARSVPAAREASALAAKLMLGSRVVLASDLGVYHLLSSVSADPDLERFVEAQLGPLLEQDARAGSDLVVTLDAYLEAGLSKTAAAAALGIRRQTLYGRLDRITRLLGGLDLADRQRRTALDLALLSWRMRSSAAGRV
jgi:PucR family transcriptional regulator, purine catabolism regulatory protein